MTCWGCGSQMQMKRGDYRYEESGLSHVVLKNIEIYHCPKCGQTMPRIKQIKKLHKAITEQLVGKQARLAGEELRFLRKEMQLKAIDLARLMGVHKVTVSKWETGQYPVPAAVDRVIRLLYLLDQMCGLETITRDLPPIREGGGPQRITIAPKEWAAAR
ncbi:MAG: type II TA system antitoxin MqsA family protein [candidate division WOR-3 bacterium]